MVRIAIGLLWAATAHSLAVGSLLLTEIPAIAQQPDLALKVRVYVYVGVPARIMVEAQNEVAYIFGRAGVRIAWQECLSSSEREEEPACKPAMGNRDVMVRIIEKAPFTTPFGNELLGFAIPPFHTTVYHAAITEVCNSVNVAPGQILGLAIAHELGHLLLGPGSHSRMGTMRATWDKEDFQAAKQRRLHFTAEEACRLRAEVNQRIHP